MSNINQMVLENILREETLARDYEKKLIKSHSKALGQAALGVAGGGALGLGIKHGINKIRNATMSNSDKVKEALANTKDAAQDAAPAATAIGIGGLAALGAGVAGIKGYKMIKNRLKNKG